MKATTISIGMLTRYRKQGRALNCHRCGRGLNAGEHVYRTRNRYYCSNCSEKMEI